MNPKIDSKKALFFVLITVMISSIGFGIIIPVLPDLLKELTGLPNNEAAIHGGWLTFVFAVMQFICMPIVGALSDRFGRRKIMLFSLFGLSIDYFIMAFAPTLIFLYFGRIIAGGLGATFSTANAYIADVSPPETRAQNFGLVGAAFGIGFMLGPVIGGLLGEFGPRVPFFAAGIFGLINVIFGFLFLPETLTGDNRRPFEWKRANAFGAVKSLSKISGAKGLIFVMFLLAVAHTVYPSTYAFSTQEGLNWDSGDVGLSLGAFGLASIIVQGGLIRIIIPKTGLFWAGIIGILSTITAYMVMGFAHVGWMIYLAGIFAAFAGLTNPAVTNMMSSRINASEQGELQGVIGAAQGLALMIGPLAMTRTFEYFAGENSDPYIPGAPFMLAGLLAIMAIVVYFIVTNENDRKAQLPGTKDALESAE